MPYRIDNYSRIRAELDISKKTGRAITDKLSGDPGRFGRGSNLRLEFLLKHGGVIADPSNVAAVRLRVLSTEDPDSTLAIDKTIGPTEMNPGITQDEWDTGDPSKAHLIFQLTSSETAEGVFTGALADSDVEHWFLLTYNADASLLFAGTVKSFDAATGAAGTPPLSGTAASVEAVAAMINAMAGGFVKYVGNPPGRTLELTGSNGHKTQWGTDSEGNPIIGTQVTT